MRHIAFGALLVIPAVASADPDTVETELRALALSPTDGAGFHAAAFAQLVEGHTDESEGSLAVGGEIYDRGANCDYVRAGGQARIAYAGGLHPTAEQWGSVCISPITMEIAHHLEWDVRPSLLAPLLLRAGENRRETVTFHWTPLHGKYGHILGAVAAGEAKRQGVAPTDPVDPEDPKLPQGELVIFDVRTAWTMLWSADHPMAMEQSAEATPFGYVRRQLAPWGEERDYTVDIGAGGGDFVDNGATVHVWLVRIQNGRIGPLYATGGIGITGGGVGKFLEAKMHREVDVTTPRAVLGIETGGSRVHGYLRGTNEFELNPDGFVAVDQRLAGGLGLDVGNTRALLDAAIAKTKVWRPQTLPVEAATGGASVALAQHLTPHLDATLHVEVARSFYAADVKELDFMPRWGVNAFAALQAVVGR